jgi:hypothetical protein
VSLFVIVMVIVMVFWTALEKQKETVIVLEIVKVLQKESQMVSLLVIALT